MALSFTLKLTLYPFILHVNLQLCNIHVFMKCPFCKTVIY